MKNIYLLIISFSLSLSISVNAQHNHSLDKSSSKFIENKGQWDESILFYSELSGAEVAVMNGSVNYLLKDNNKYDSLVRLRHDGLLNSSLSGIDKNSNLIDYCLVKMEILGAKNSAYNGFKSYSEKRNYFLGNDSTKWARNVISYEAVQTGEILDGVDFKIYHHSNSIKHEFHVDSKIDYKKIKLKYSGYESIKISEAGELEIQTNVGLLKEDHPVAYQIIKGKHHFVKCEFKLNQDSTISYKLGRTYRKNYPLVIDPQLIFSTASGSSADNWGNTACLDNEGNLYTGGTVFDSPIDGFPATPGAFQSNFQGNDNTSRITTDIGILKFDSSGHNLLYATYIGGNDSEIPTSVITNDKGELFILAVTGSEDFPSSTNSFSGGSQFEPVGGYDFFNGSDIVIIKLSSNGSNVIKSRYVGGTGNDGTNLKRSANSIEDAFTIINYGDELRGELVIDKEENIYVASSTNNNKLTGNIDTTTSFPIKNAFQNDFGGGRQDGVVFKMHHSLDSLVWSSYIGGSGADAAYGIKIAPDSNIYVTGISGSNNMFTQNSSALNPDFFGNYDAFVARISPDGSIIKDYTYLGTPEKDAGYFVELDNEGFPHILGQTFGDYGHSNDSIYFNDREGVFIHKLSPELDSSIYYTTIGDMDDNEIAPNFSPTAFLINECGNVFISGWGGADDPTTNETETGSNYDWTGRTENLPVTENAFSKTSDGADFYLAVFLKDMDTLLFATYFGVDGVAEHVDGGTSRFDDSGIVYQSVCAGCGDKDFVLFPEKSTGDYPKQNGSTNCNNGVFKYDLASLDAVIKAEGICAPLTTTFTNETLGGIEYTWDFGDGTDSTLVNKIPVEHTYEKAGTYQVKMITTDITTCKRKDTTSLTITVSDKLIPKVLGDTICKTDTKEITEYEGIDFNSFLWTPNSGVSNDTSRTPTLTAIESTDYTITLQDSLGCIRIDTFKLFVPKFIPDLQLDIIPNCKHNSTPQVELTLNYKSNFIPNTITWNINGTEFITSDSTFIYNPERLGLQQVTSSTKSKECEFIDTGSVNIIKTEIPNIITPNGDGLNDNFVLSGIQGSGKWKLDINNRWGKRIYRSLDYQNDWQADGEGESTYFYEVESPDGNKCKGWIQVVR